MNGSANGHHRVMVVDDDPDILDALQEVLAEDGYKVVVACNGHDAFRELQNGTMPHLILLDLMMPVMDGWQFRALQKRDPVLSRIPVVVLSAYRRPRREEADPLDAVAYLPKPVKLDELLNTVRRYV